MASDMACPPYEPLRAPVALPPPTPTAMDMHRIIEEVRINAEREAEAKYAAHKRRGVVDELKELVNYGDIIIRKVGNGWVIRKIPGAVMQGMPIETWVVEGNDIKLVGDQLTAIQANDAMGANQANTIPSRAPGGTAMAAAGMALDANNINIALGRFPR